MTINYNFNLQAYLWFIAFMVILTTYLPIVYTNIPSAPGSHHFYVLIWFASVLFLYPRILAQKYILFLLFYGFVFALLMNTLWEDMDQTNTFNRINEFYIFWVAITIVVYFIMIKDYEGLARLVKWSLIFIGITAVFTLYSLSIDSQYIRNMTGADNSKWAIERFQTLGGGNYGYISALVALFPLMFYYFRNNNLSIFSKKVIIAYGVMCYITIIGAQIFTNILLATIIIILSFVGRKDLLKTLIIGSVISTIILIIPKTFYAEILVDLSSFVDPDTNLYYKLNDMAIYIVYGDRYATGLEGRADRYPQLFAAFSESPLLGYYAGEQTKPIMAGMHLFWMNYLTVSGIFAFSAYLFIHIGFIKSAIKFFNKEYTFYFLLSVFAVISLGIFKVLIGRELWLTYFIILPGAYFLPLLKKGNKNQIAKNLTETNKNGQKSLPARPIDTKNLKW